MNWTVGIVSLLLIAVIGYLLNEWVFKGGKNKEYHLPYKLNPRFFTRSEFALYKELKKQVGDKYEIFPKVRLADFIEVDVDKNKDRSRWYIYWNKIKSKHIDFLLCDTQTLEPKVAIELNGKSHKTEHMGQRDEFVSKVYEKINLKFFVIEVGQSFSTSVDEILPLLPQDIKT